jgi:stage II sporulation protein D
LIIFTSALFCINLLKEKGEREKAKIEQDKKDKEEKYEIDYKASQTIRVKFSKTGEIVAMDINDYLRGVVPAEMPPSYGIEALKAQAVVARTFTYKRMESMCEGTDADICDNYAHCQAFYTKDKIFQIWKNKGYDEQTINDYWSKVNEAVVSTENEVITYKGEYIKAFFHASSPVKTENIDQIWGGEKLDYLVSVDNVESDNYVNRSSTVELNFEDIANRLKTDDISRSDINVDDIKNISIYDYTTSGRVKNIKVCGFIISAEKLRTLFGLKSTNFTIEVKEDSVVFNVIGYGHGIGMSQVGADYLSSQGKSYIDIIKYYYTGVNVNKLDSK